MKIKNLLKSMSGVSLVEMTVVLGLMGVAAVGVMKLTETADKAGKNIAVKDDISQFQNQLNDILKNPNNCEAALSSKTIGSSFFISQVINGVITPKYVAEAIPANPNKVSIASMTLLSVDRNGSNGSQSLATLRVGFRKPTKGSIGAQIINKEITINANLCNKNIIQIASTAPISTLMSQCTSTSGNVRMVDGPHTWGAIKWAVCQDCSDAVVNANTIKTCQSQGSGGGVDIGSLSELTCANQGGVWNTTTSSCDTDDSTSDASCTSLSGNYDPATKKCNAITTQVAAHVAALPQCILSEEACTGLYPNASATYNMTKNVVNNVPTYNRSCTTRFNRKSNTCCTVSYNAYGHYNTNACTTGYTTNSGATCGPSGGSSHWADCKVAGVGWEGNCFEGTSPSCSTIGTSTTPVAGTSAVPVNKCCK